MTPINNQLNQKIFDRIKSQQPHPKIYFQATSALIIFTIFASLSLSLLSLTFFMWDTMMVVSNMPRRGSWLSEIIDFGLFEILALSVFGGLSVYYFYRKTDLPMVKNRAFLVIGIIGIILGVGFGSLLAINSYPPARFWFSRFQKNFDQSPYRKHRRHNRSEELNSRDNDSLASNLIVSSGCQPLLKPILDNSLKPSPKIKLYNWLELTQEELDFANKNADREDKFLKVYLESIKCGYKNQVKVLTTPSFWGSMTVEKWNKDFDVIWDNLANKQFTNLTKKLETKPCNGYYADYNNKKYLICVDTQSNLNSSNKFLFTDGLKEVINYKDN